jgi:hypothetical protein
MSHFKLVGFLMPSKTSKTFKAMYALEELRRIAKKTQFSNKKYVFLGLIQREVLHKSLHAYPLVQVEICTFINAYALNERKTEQQTLNFMPVANPEKLSEVSSNG